MYLDKLNNEIEEEMYKRISKQLLTQNENNKNKIKILEKSIQEKKDNKKNNSLNIDKYLKLNRNLITNIIEKITIDKNNNIEIYYKISDPNLHF